LVTKFHQIWQVAAAINTEQCLLNCPLHLEFVHTLPCYVIRDRIVRKYCNFTQLSAKLTQDLRQKQ